MIKKKQEAPRRWRSKEAKAIAKAVKTAGGEVVRSGKGHMKITGPKGVAFVASDPGSNRLEKTYETIRERTGLEVWQTKNEPGH